MKLIVLYGPENSGKTTTLKMVYDVLKKFNVLETNQFRYLDKEPDTVKNLYGVDTSRLDFLDILYVLKDKTTNSKNDASNVNQSKQKIDTNSLDKLFDDIDKIIDDYASQSKVQKECDFETLKQSVNQLLSHRRPIYPDDLYSVGIATQGDYDSTTTRKYARSVEEHLEDLKGCDIIICACTKKTTNPPKQCIIDFVNKHLTEIDDVEIVIAYPFNPTDDKNTKTPIELRRANEILNHLKNMIS